MKLISRMRPLVVSVVLAAAGAAFAAGCSSDEGGSLPMVDCSGTVPKFAQVTLFTQVCNTCHSSTKSGPDRSNAPVNINFDTYEAAKTSASKAVSAVYGGSMPPANAQALAEADKQALYAWGLCGTPQ